MTASLYDQRGAGMHDEVITEFYQRAFVDPLIGHFFFHSDKAALIAKQIIFTSNLLGAKHLTYTGKSLKEAHSKLPLREVHFRRRQRLLEEVLVERAVAGQLREQWLKLEEKLKPLIINDAEHCLS
jgi:truncated hemoglobin YjbI